MVTVTTAPRVDHVAFLCGLLAGISQAGLFNPYDRALYLSVTNRTPFLAWENWKVPYQGFLQSVGGRALSGGLYVVKLACSLLHTRPFSSLTYPFCRHCVA